jgi:hypothetical protein
VYFSFVGLYWPSELSFSIRLPPIGEFGRVTSLLCVLTELGPLYRFGEQASSAPSCYSYQKFKNVKSGNLSTKKFDSEVLSHSEALK